MSNSSHTAVHVSEVPTPAQLKEFHAQIESGRITKDSLQQVLRGGSSTTISFIDPAERRLKKLVKAVVDQVERETSVAFIDWEYTKVRRVHLLLRSKQDQRLSFPIPGWLRSGYVGTLLEKEPTGTDAFSKEDFEILKGVVADFVVTYFVTMYPKDIVSELEKHLQEGKHLEDFGWPVSVRVWDTAGDGVRVNLLLEGELLLTLGELLTNASVCSVLRSVFNIPI